MRFKKRFRGSGVHPVNVFDLAKLGHVGKYSYGPLRVLAWNASNERLDIGNLVSIAEDVTFVLGGNHPMSCPSTFPFHSMILGDREDVSETHGPIVVQDDVWIGFGATILSGVTLGRGSVVGARAVVTRDVEPYTVVVGCPARAISRRFSLDRCQRLTTQFDPGTIDREWVKQHVNWLDVPLDDAITKGKKS